MRVTLRRQRLTIVSELKDSFATRAQSAAAKNTDQGGAQNKK